MKITHIGNMSSDRQRNGLLDQNKLIAAFFVILLHSPFPGIVGEAFESLARFAVPFFFMVSGYYVYDKPRKAIKKSLLKNLLLLASSLVLYVAWDLAWSLYQGNTAEKFETWFSLQSIIDIFIFNNGVLLGHLWFILALIYCYLIYLAVSKLGFKAKLIISTVLLVMNFALNIVLTNAGITDPGYFTRNFLFTGLPFFMIGELFAYGKFSLNGKKLLLWVTMVAGIVLTILQRFCIGFSELYLGSVLICVALFALTISRQMPSSNLLANIGKRANTSVYVLHVIIIACLNMAGSVLGMLQSTAFLLVRPFATLLLSIVAAYILYAIKTKVNSRRVKE